MENRIKEITVNITSLLSWFISLLSFFIPFVLPHQQLLTGIAVNCFLFLSAKYLSDKQLFPVIFLPSIAALGQGLLFGSFTPFLLYFLPFIWLGNYILIHIFRKKGFLLASIAKFLLLYFSANLYFSLHLVPKLFLQSMGLFQLITALIAGLVITILFR